MGGWVGAWLGACVRACVGGWVRPCVRPCAFHLSDDEPRPLTSPAPRPPPHCIVLRPAVSLCHPPSTTPTTTGAPHTTRMPARTPCLHTAHTHIPTQTHTHTHTHTHTRTHTRSPFAPRSHRPHTTHCPLPPTRTHAALSFAWLCLWATVSARPTPFRPRPRPHPLAHPTRTHPWCPPDTRSASRGTYTHTAHITPPPPHPRSTTCACPRHTTTRRLLPGSSPVGSREFEGGDGVGVLGYVHIE